MSSCNSIASEIAALRADIAALDNKYVLKNDSNRYLLREEKEIIIASAVTTTQNWATPKFAFLTPKDDPDIVKKALGVLANAFRAKIENDIERFQRLEQAIREATRDKEAENIAALNKKIDAYNSRLDALEKDFKLKDQRTRDRVYALEKQFPITKKQANDALYEVREGRKKLESQIAESRKLGNDALYEVRQGRERIESQIAESRKLGNDALYEVRQGREKIEAEIAESRKLGNDALYEVRQGREKIEAEIIRKNQETQVAIERLQTTFNNDLSKLQNQIINIPKPLQQNPASPTNINDLIDSKISSLESRLNSNAQQSALTNAISQAIAAETKKQEVNLINQNIYSQTKLRDESDKRWNQLLKEQDLFTNGAFDRLNAIAEANRRELNDFARKSDLEVFISQYGSSYSLSKTAELEAIRKREYEELRNGITSFQKTEKTVKEIIKEKQADREAFREETKKNLAPLITKQNEADNELDKIRKMLTPTTTKQKEQDDELDKLKRRIIELENMDKEANKKLDAIIPKLDQMIPTIAGIPIVIGRIPSTIAPMIPTIPQIGNIVQDKVCNPQCQLPSISAGNNAATAANNANNNLGNKIDGLKNGADAAAQAAQLALLETINKKLGAEIVGGIGGKLVDGFKWLHLDRVLNILTFAATVQNHLMLSNDIGQTLLGAFNNVIQLIGIKDDKGQAINVGEIINSTFENLVKGIVGAENYTQLSTAWAKANRVYQATTNVLNSFLNLSQTILQASELIAAYTGRIGNALKKGGVILENAYGWMNPQPKFNRVTQTLESLQNGASTIQMVTQAPLDVINATTEFNNSATEFVKAIKEDDKPENKAVAQPEPDELKAKETQSKTDSQPSPFDFFDLFDGED
jgi:hypothetical protein